MRHLLLLCFALFFCSLTAQNYAYDISGHTTGNLPEITASDFSFFVVLNDAADWSNDLAITFQNERALWDFTLDRDDHSPAGKMSTLGFASRELNRFTIDLPAGVLATLHIYDPGVTSAPLRPVTTLNSVICPYDAPPVITRENWCPAGNCDPVSSPAPTEVTHLIVHHSAGTNTANDWAAIVRAIRNAHVVGNGWDDVGYNYLIDPNGLIYVGRGNDTRGAHFCGDNTGTMGTCLLGNFTDQIPADEAVLSLQQLLAWKACDREIDPLGTSFHAAGNQNLFNIAGHRQGCSTACPGDAFFPQFEQLRQNVARTIAGLETVGVSGNSTENKLLFFPNPSQGSIKITGLNGVGELAIYATAGQLILQQTIRNGDFIEAISFQGAGVYWAVVTDADGRKLQKLVRR